MSLTKSASQAMNYEKAGTKAITDPKRVATKMAEQLGTPSLVWLIVKRHKVGLLALGNIILVLNFVFPAWFDMVLGLIGK